MSYSMRHLFQQETSTHVDRLKQSFAALRQQPDSANEIDAALRSIRAIVGVAHLIEFDAVVRLSEAMQDCLTAAQSQALSIEKIDSLLHGCTLLLQMSRIEVSELKQWLTDHAEDLAATQTAIENQSLSQSAQPQGFLEQKESVTPPVQGVEPISEPVEGDRSPPAVIASATQSLVQDDPGLMELFRQEVEAQTIALNQGLIAIEAQPNSTQKLESLMRAAHSIKGAARIVGLDAAVDLSHRMEDCFVAAQNQTITLRAAQIDALFRSVDLIQTLSQTADVQQWLSHHQSELESIRSALSFGSEPEPTIVPDEPAAVPIEPTTVLDEPAIVSDEPAIVSDEPAIIPIVRSERSPEPESSAPRDRAVRISADILNRIVGLAGESMVEAHWLQPFTDSLMHLRSRQLALSKILEELQQSLQQTDLLEQLRHQERECRNLLSDRIIELGEYIRRTDNLSDRLYREVIRSQMQPFVDGVQGFPRMVRDLAHQLGKQVNLSIIGEQTAVDRDILKKLEVPLTHILRNAVDHGLELPQQRIEAGKPAEGTIVLEAGHRGGMLMITVSDDGKGIDPNQVRQQIIRRSLATPEVAHRMSHSELMEFLFLPGFSLSKKVTELSGRGVGLDIVKAMAQEVSGTVRAMSSPGVGTSFHFQLPLTLSVVRTLLVEIASELYAFPLSRIDRIISLDRDSISIVENQPYFTDNDQNVGLISLHQVFNLPAPASTPESLCVIILSYQSALYGLIVDRALGERELVVRPLDPRLGKVQDISAAALMSDGGLVLIVDVSDLVRSMNLLLEAGRLTPVGEQDSKPMQKRILVVDDSITVREVERKLLEKQGYQVDVAIDGVDGWNAVHNQAYDLVISDIDMPRMNGIELIQQIKTHPRLRSIPVIVMSYRDRESDRLQGLDAGADYYLTKNSFQDNSLIQAVVDLIGQ